MKCKSCKNNLNENWRFCPHCGNSIARTFRIKAPQIFRKRENSNSFETIRMPFGMGNIQISIGSSNPDNFFRPEIKEEPIENSRTQQKQRKVQNVVEPEAKIKTSGYGIEIEIEMPGVSENDVEINKIGESLEVRGYSKKTTYFKVIPINKNLGLLSQELKNNVLKIKMGK